jgi:hypothetical protein
MYLILLYHLVTQTVESEYQIENELIIVDMVKSIGGISINVNRE